MVSKIAQNGFNQHPDFNRCLKCRNFELKRKKNYLIKLNMIDSMINGV